MGDAVSLAIEDRLLFGGDRGYPAADIPREVGPGLNTALDPVLNQNAPFDIHTME